MTQKASDCLLSTSLKRKERHVTFKEDRTCCYSWWNEDASKMLQWHRLKIIQIVTVLKF